MSDFSGVETLAHAKEVFNSCCRFSSMPYLTFVYTNIGLYK